MENKNQMGQDPIGQTDRSMVEQARLYQRPGYVDGVPVPGDVLTVDLKSGLVQSFKPNYNTK